MLRGAIWLLLILSSWALATSIPSLPSGWSYAGCMDEGSGRRGMNSTFYGRDDMTDNLCIEYCSQWSFTYAGIEMGTQCFCGNSYTLFTLAEDSECSYACSGASGQPCGGYGYMTLFKYSSSTTTAGKSTTAGTTTTAAAAATSSTPTSNAQSSNEANASPATSSGSSLPTSDGSSILSSTGLASAASSMSSGTAGSFPTSLSGSETGSTGLSHSSKPSTASTAPATLPAVASATDTGVNFAATPRTRDPAQEIVFGYVLDSGCPSIRVQQPNLIGCVIWLCLALSVLFEL